MKLTRPHPVQTVHSPSPRLGMRSHTQFVALHPRSRCSLQILPVTAHQYMQLPSKREVQSDLREDRDGCVRVAEVDSDDRWDRRDLNGCFCSAVWLRCHFSVSEKSWRMDEEEEEQLEGSWAELGSPLGTGLPLGVQNLGEID